MVPSSTVENYLKAIYMAQSASGDHQELVPMGRLASALRVVPGTATTMVKTLADSGLVVGRAGAVVAGAAGASAWLSQPARPGPRRDERDLVCAPDGLSVERVERDRDLLVEFGPSTLPGVGASRRVL